MLNYDDVKALVGARELSHDIGGEREQGGEDEDNTRMGCSRQTTASSCSGNISGTPQTDADTAMMHAFRGSSSYPDIATIASFSAALQSP